MERQRKGSGGFMIGEREGAWLVCHWALWSKEGGPVGRGDDPPNSHQKSPT